MNRNISDSYEIEFWNSPETALRLDNNTDYHAVMHCDERAFANTQYSLLSKQYEFVVLKLIKRFALEEYHKTNT